MDARTIIPEQDLENHPSTFFEGRLDPHVYPPSGVSTQLCDLLHRVQQHIQDHLFQSRRLVADNQQLFGRLECDPDARLIADIPHKMDRFMDDLVDPQHFIPALGGDAAEHMGGIDDLAHIVLDLDQFLHDRGVVQLDWFDLSWFFTGRL